MRRKKHEMAIIGDTKTTVPVRMNMNEEMLAFARRQSDAYSMFGIEDYLRGILNRVFVEEWDDFAAACEKESFSIHDALIRDGYLPADWKRKPPSPPEPI